MKHKFSLSHIKDRQINDSIDTWKLKSVRFAIVKIQFFKKK